MSNSDIASKESKNELNIDDKMIQSFLDLIVPHLEKEMTERFESALRSMVSKPPQTDYIFGKLEPICPECSEILDRDFIFCPCCAQRIDWEKFTE